MLNLRDFMEEWRFNWKELLSPYGRIAIIAIVSLFFFPIVVIVSLALGLPLQHPFLKFILQVCLPLHTAIVIAIEIVMAVKEYRNQFPKPKFDDE